MTVVAGVGVTLGATVDPHAARPRAAIAAPAMVVRFMSASTPSTGTPHNSYIRAKASNTPQGDGSASPDQRGAYFRIWGCTPVHLIQALGRTGLPTGWTKTSGVVAGDRAGQIREQRPIEGSHCSIATLAGNASPGPLAAWHGPATRAAKPARRPLAACH